MSEKVEFTVPNQIKDFVFMLRESVRRSLRLEDVQQYYEVKFGEISDKTFKNSPWPDAKVIASEASNDQQFLLLYREMTIRHISTKLKPQLSDHIASWANYLSLFDFILSAKEDELLLTTQWIYDIVQEFVYQFQGFCQYRNNVSLKDETIKTLEANRHIWNLAEVYSVLTRLINAGRTKAKSINASSVTTDSPVIMQFGYFASIELARLECLLGDYASSLEAVSFLKLGDRSELYTQLVTCHFNVYYHMGVSNLMLRRFSEAVEIFCDIVMHISRVLKPGGSTGLRHSAPTQLPRMLEKVLSLAAIVITLHPSHRVDNQVLELVEAKLGDKFRRCQAGDKAAFVDLFESSSPKFISPAVPTYGVSSNSNHDFYRHQVNTFATEVSQHLPFLKLRSFLILYAAIDVSKLARFNDVSEADLVAQLISLKNKAIQLRTNPKTGVMGRSNVGDVHYYLRSDVVVIHTEKSTKQDTGKSSDRYFAVGLRKNTDIIKQLKGNFKRLGL